ncbi:MAG: PA2169 family four-helix-bundle protein [Oscillospiraceae bacterium]|nr:PA2169 family four-helix-bundle protein [Oscillospiraceae bacterium]
MTDDMKMLNTITETTDMGRDSLNHVMEKAADPQLKSVLQKQFDQYDQTYKAARQMLGTDGEKPKTAGAPLKMYSHMVSNMKTMASGDADSKIAEMVIQGSTMGVTEMTKQLHDYQGSNQALRNLAQTHIQTEQDNIEEMKKYL